MIERFYLQDNLSFKNIELYFKSGLILFTGPSGAGKSVLLNSILATLGQKESGAKLAETIFNNSMNLESFGIESEEITVFKQMKKEKTRYFINNQTVSRKVVSKIGELFINHLNPRDITEFESDNLLSTLDAIGISKNENLENLLQNYNEEFAKFENLLRASKRLKLEISEMAEKEDFIKFEIAKIDHISPKIGEDTQLQLTKKRLSKKDRIENYIDEVEIIFEKRMALFEIFDLMGLEEEGKEIEIFFEEVKSKLEDIVENLSELDGINVEKLLDRIEKISELREKYGSIDKAIEYRDSKEAELNRLAELRKDISQLQKELNLQGEKLMELGKEISENRQKSLQFFEEYLNEYLSLLNLGISKLILSEVDFSKSGIDFSKLYIAGTEIDKLSYGEQNRVRLAILTLKTKFKSGEFGTLFLDEIDANLSGNESMQVAKVLKELSKSYQVFAISHQPQLTSQADQHFLVYKENEESFVKELANIKEKSSEIIRMIGGEQKDENVRQFALNLLKN
jgi:DNA repair protein RecN (Recombination protein N)